MDALDSATEPSAERSRARGAPDASGADVGEVVSDAMFNRIVKIMLVVLAGTVVVAGVAGVAVWAFSEDPVDQPMNAVDVGFLQDMIDHHEQALLISNIYLDERPDSGVAPYAREVLPFQEREIEWMKGWLAEEGYEIGEPDRMAMTWMGMSMPVGEMPGMQSPERLAELDAATGIDADRLFFRIMAEHHRGGIHMGDFASANGQRKRIIEFAASVSRNQTIEIVEYQAAWERLGLG
ncbi:MAG: DUF305 domain-containing protein [Ilumatobacter sp.]|uniref:DUF305 domain-containing protein n=1 Tax=Ilumatobacter sp. TaxID=1967498 RepID=UPI00391C4544